MKHLKYLILSVLLTANLFCVPVFSAEESTASEEAKGLVEALELMPEIKDYESEITRGAFTYAVSRLLNTDVVNIGAKSTFYDTEGNEWEPYIAALASANIVEGCMGNVFEPNRAITEFEAVKILMRALGYNYIIDTKGASPAIYLKEASDSGLTKGVVISDSKGLSYEKCIKLLFNALSVSVVEMADLGTNVSFKASKDKKALSLYHDVYKAEGRVTSIGAKSVKLNEKASKNHVIIDSEDYINSFLKTEDYFGMKVKYYYRSKSTDTDKYLIFAILAPEVKILKIEADDLIEVKNKSVSYYDAKDVKRTETIELACDVVKNGNAVQTVNDSDFNITDGEIVLIDNDDNGSYDTVFIKSYVNYVVDSVEEENGEYKIKPMFNMPWIEIDTLKSGYSMVIKNSDGTVSNDISSIPNGAVISVSSDKTRLSPSGKTITDKDSKYYEIYVSTAQVEGEYTAESETCIFVDGKEYETADQNYLNETKIDKGSKIALLLDYFGKAMAWNAAASEGGAVFGYLINGKVTDSMGTNMEVKLMDTDGEIIMRRVNGKCRLNSSKIKNYESLIKSLYESARHANPQKTDMAQLIKYTENESGEIDYIETTLCSSGVPAGENKNHLRISGSKLKLSRKGGDNFWDLNTGLTGCVTTGGVKFYVVPMDDYDGNDDNFRKINVNDNTWQLYEAYAKTVDLYNFDDTIIPEVIVIYGSSADDAIENWVMVDKIENALDETGTEEKRIRVVSGTNGIKSIPIEYPEKFEGLKQGDVITIYGVNDKARSYEMNISLEQAKKYAKLYKNSISDTLSVDSGKMTSFGEAYAVNGEGFKMQCGPYKEGSSSNEREMQWGALWADSKNYLPYGSVMYDAESSKPKIEKTNKPKTVCAISNPNEPDLAYIYYKSGQPQCIVIYRGLPTE